MVKAEIKTPNKRKSVGNATPAKKIKIENGQNEFKPFTPKISNQTPKKNKQGSLQKNKQVKTEFKLEKKDVKPFTGTKKLNEGKKPKKINKKGNQNSKDGENKDATVSKRKRRNQFSTLIQEVKAKEGSKDADILKKITQRIEAITSKGELSKTAKRKLGLLKKLKIICEEGASAAAAKSKAKVEAEKAAAAKKKAAVVKTEQPKKKKAAKVEIAKTEDDEDSDNEEQASDDEDEDDSDEAESEDEENNDEEEGEDEEESEDEEDDDSDEESDDDAPAPQEKSAVKQWKSDVTSTSKSKHESNKRVLDNKQPNLDDLKNKEIVKKGQKRFVLFIGNIAYDTQKKDILEHFAKIGNIVDIRIPVDTTSNKPRGFAYLEVHDETAYERCLSMHHSQMKGRRINVLYTQGGKRKGDDKKKEIKAKNMKLHALRKQGKLAGSVKQSQKRSFRRNKAKNKVNSGDN